MLVSLALAGVFGARLRENPEAWKAHATSAPPRGSATRLEAPRPRDQAAAVADASWLLQRLEKAETGTELCELLGRLEPSDEPRATYAITAVLERTRLRSVRACATTALAAQPSPAAHSWLVDLAEDPEPEVHRTALEALALQTDMLALTTVSDAAHSADVDVRVAAVIALLKARRAETFALAKDLSETLDDASKLGELIDALAQSGDVRVLPVLQSLIARGDRETHVRAISALGVLGTKQALPLLWPYLQVGSEDEFRAAADALARLEPDSVLPKLVATLRESSARRRVLALSTLTRLELPGVLDVVVELLDSDEPELLVLALRHLASTHDPAFESRFAALARSDEPRTRQAALRALAQLETPGALSELHALSNDSSTELANLALDALDRAPAGHAELTARRLQRVSRAPADGSGDDDALELSKDPSPAAQDALLAYFSSAERPTAMLERVVEGAPSGMVAELAARFGQSTDVEQRRVLIQELANRAEPRFSEDLRRAVSDEDESIRRVALRGLMRLGDEAASHELTRLLDAPEADERHFAIEQLFSHADDAGLSRLAALASDPDSDVATTALTTLKGQAPARAAKLAQSLFERGSSEQRSALFGALRELHGSLTRPIYEAGLNDPSDDTAQRSIAFLAGLEGPRAARQLLAVARDPARAQEVRSAAAGALRNLGGPLARQNRALLDELSERPAQEPVICRTAS